MDNRAAGTVVLVGRLRTFSAAILVVGLVTTVVGGFLPWVRLGRRQRNSFELTGLLNRVDVLHIARSSPRGIAIRLWPFIGLLAGVAVALVMMQQLVLAAALGAATGAFAVGLGAAVISAPVAWQAGAVTALAGGVISFLGSVLILAAAGTPRWRRKPL